MTDTGFTLPLQVTLYDLDVREQVSCATLFRFFEETAMQGSSHFGFTLEWYRERGQFWVIRTLQMVRSCAPGYLEELELDTWISSMARVRSDRNYLVTRKRDGREMARGIANWVFVDAAAQSPARIPPEITSRFDMQSAPALPPIGKVQLHPARPARLDLTLERTAQYYEADSALHINNAIYVDWVEEAVRNTLAAFGYAQALDGSTPWVWFHSHALEYVQSAVPGDTLRVRTRLVRQRHTSGEWETEIRHAGTGAQLLRARSTMLWVDAHNRPVRWQAPARQALVPPQTEIS